MQEIAEYRRPRREHVPAPETVGRSDELRRIHTHLAQTTDRLITLVGSPGSGKSHLARVIQSESPVGEDTLLITITASHDPSQLLPFVAEALDIQPSSRRSDSPEPTDSLIHQINLVISDRPTLVIMDGIEHLLPDASQLIASLLAQSPTMTILATSHKPLSIPGEHVIDVAPLLLPDRDRVLGSGSSALTRNPSAELFSIFARKVDPQFRITNDNAVAVMDTVTHLAGLPLAIELAAAHLGTMSIEQLASALPYTSPSSLTALLEQTTTWSYAQLSEEDQRIFRHLSFFIDGFDGETVTAITGMSNPAVMLGLANLSERGLITSTVLRGNLTRYRLLDLPRSVAAILLDHHGEVQSAHDRQVIHFMTLALQADAATFHADQNTFFKRLELERHDLHGVLTWLDTEGRHREYIQLASACKFFWVFHTHYPDGLAALQRALQLADEIDPSQKGPLLIGIGFIGFFQADLLRYEESCNEARQFLDSTGSARDRALCLLGQATVAVYHHHEFDLGLRLHREATAVANQHTEGFGLGFTVLHRSNLALTDALMTTRPIHETVSQIERSIAFFHAMNAPWLEMHVLTHRVIVAVLHGDLAEALGSLKRQMELTHDHAFDKRAEAEAIASIALLAGLRDQPERAAVLLGAHDLLIDQIGGPILYYLSMNLSMVPQLNAATKANLDMDSLRKRLRSRLGEFRFAYLLTTGRRLLQAQRLAIANSVTADWPQVVAGLVTVAPHPLHPLTEPDLKPRHLDVLELMETGLHDDEICAILDIARRTVTSRVSEILEATGAYRNRQRAGAYARARGVIGTLPGTLVTQSRPPRQAQIIPGTP